MKLKNDDKLSETPLEGGILGIGVMSRIERVH